MFTGRQQHDAHNYMEEIPLEMLHEILLYVKPKDIKNICDNIGSWKGKLHSQNLFWKRKCQADYYEALTEPFKTDSYKKILSKFSSEWQGIFAYNMALQQNWENCIAETVLVKNKIKFNKVYYFDDETLIVSTLCSKILFIDYATKSVTKKFDFEKREILKLVKNDDILIVLSYKNYLKVWDTKTGNILTDVQLDPSYNLLGATKNAIAFSAETLSCVLKLESDQFDYYETGSLARCGSFHNDLLFLGLDNGTVKVIDFMERSSKVLECFNEKRVRKLQILNDTFLVLFSEDADICVWNMETNSNLHQFYTGVRLDWELFEAIIFIGQNKVILRESDESTIQIWNYMTGTLLFCVDNGNLLNSFITANKHYIFTGSYGENLIKMWCNKTGNLIKKLNFRYCYSGPGQFLVTDTKVVLVKPCYSASKKLYVLDYSKDVTVEKGTSNSFSERDGVCVWNTQTDFEVFKSYTYEMELEPNLFGILQIATNFMDSCT